MFGLENQKKKKKAEEFVFDLEKEILSKGSSTKQKAEERVQKLKEYLRTGEDKEEFDRYGILLHGYTALQKVLSRIGVKSS